MNHPRRSRARRLSGLLASVLVASVLVVGGLALFQRQLIYLPGPARAPSAAESGLPGALDVTVHTGDGLRLGAWHVPAREERRDLTVLVVNGNAGNRSARASIASALAGRGFDVLLFDYRGFGGNPGRPDERGLAEDARSARRHLTDERGVAPDRILYLGESLGAAVATRLATEAPPAGLVLRSPFADLAAAGEVAYPMLPVRALLVDEYPVAAQAARLDIPVTVVFGTADRTTPPAQSLAVATAARARVVAVPGADHQDARFDGGPALVDAVDELATRVVAHR